MLRACLSQWHLSAEHTAMFLLHYVGTAWETWDLTPTDAVAAAPLPLYSSTSLVLHAADALRAYRGCNPLVRYCSPRRGVLAAR